MKKQDISRVSKHLSQIAINYGSGSNKYPHILWHLSLQQVALSPSLLACAGLRKLASNNRLWQEKDINFRVQKLGRHPLTEVFKVNTISEILWMSHTCCYEVTRSPLGLCSTVPPVYNFSLTMRKHQTDPNTGTSCKIPDPVLFRGFKMVINKTPLYKGKTTRERG